MSIFSRLLNPFEGGAGNAIGALFDPAGQIVRTVTNKPNTIGTALNPFSGISRNDRDPGVPDGIMSSPQVPPQLQRQPVSYPQSPMLGRFSKLAYQMAGPPGGQSAPQLTQPLPGLRIPTPPNGMNAQSLPMTDPTDILRMLQMQGIY